MTTDRMSASLAAIALIENNLAGPPDEDTMMLLPETLDESLTVLASATYCAAMVIGQLALQLGVPAAAVMAELRSSIQDAYQEKDQ
jgi:hypothetical protein